MGHGAGVVPEAHVVDEDGRGVVQSGVPDLVPTRAVPDGDEGHPPAGIGRYRELGGGVAGQSVLRGGKDCQAPGILLEGMLSVAAALALLSPVGAAGRVVVGDVDEGRVPLLLLGHREVHTQQMDEAIGEQPGG